MMKKVSHQIEVRWIVKVTICRGDMSRLTRGVKEQLGRVRIAYDESFEEKCDAWEWEEGMRIWATWDWDAEDIVLRADVADARLVGAARHMDRADGQVGLAGA